MTGFFVQMKPFAEKIRNNREIVVPFQKTCIEKSICGMGWADHEMFADVVADVGEEKVFLTEQNKNLYKQKYEENHSGGEKNRMLAAALNRYAEMREGDYLLTRLFDTTECYIGKVKTKAYYCKRGTFSFPDFPDLPDLNKDPFSWIVKVESWEPIGLFSNIPNAFRGALSGRWNTIKKMSEFHCKLAHRAYEKSDEKIELNQDNFYFSLDPLDLEDLVAFYIYSQHPSYQFLPSSCKINEPTIEFKLVNGKDQITCQVKSNEEIDLNNYLDLAKAFEKIYFFSGKECKNVKNKPDRFRVIEKPDLYAFLKKNFEEKGYFYSILKRYYRFKD